MFRPLDISRRLSEEARRIGKHKSKKHAIAEGLKKYFQGRRQMRILELAGEIDFDPVYDFKKERRRR